eukprot:210641_1
MSVLLYSWNTIKVRYDTQKQDWHYILRDKTNESNESNDKIIQLIHQKNIIRLLCDNTMGSINWKLNDLLHTIESYLCAESRLKIPEISQRKYSVLHNSNNIFNSILDLFKFNEFSWQLDMNKHINLNSNLVNWKHWYCTVTLDGNIISKIQNIISYNGNKG